jgi:hypothetical protein
MSLQLPHSEAQEVQVELVQFRRGAVMLKLDLELQVVALDSQLAHGAAGTDTVPAPNAIGSPKSWKLPTSDRRAGFLAQDQFAVHMLTQVLQDIDAV